jgi:putative membrane-bound dehydrogenase-like protein
MKTTRMPAAATGPVWLLLLGLGMCLAWCAGPAIPLPVGVTGPTAATAAESTVDYSAELPRISQLGVEAARKSLQIQPGFSIQLAAAEPLLASPVAIVWDEDGRLFVAEMRGYSEHKDEKLGRIRQLFDDDDDGVYDRSAVFADGLSWPTALCCYAGGLFVGDAPDLVYLKDTDGDGVADQRRTVFTGFSVANVQGLLNSFCFAFDNRIHGAASSTGGTIRRVSPPPAPGTADVTLAGRDFSFDPRSLELRPETGGVQHGLSFDEAGGKYVCQNSDHAVRCMIDDRFLARNPFFTPPSAKESIAVDGPQAEVFRISPAESWRLLRTRLRASGLVPGPVEGGRATGYFTSATGVTIVRGDSFGDELSGMLVVGDVGSNLVHRKRLVPEGSGVRAERVDQRSELVASTDNWFRPVQFANGPDGGLWIIDMQREVIEHPGSIPQEIKRHVDLDSGRDTGRLWRLTGSAHRRRPTPKLSKCSTAELVKLFEHPNGWHHETAHRLLFERQDAAAGPLLTALADNAAAEPRARALALHALDGLGQLTERHVLRGLEAADPLVRLAAVQVAERFVRGGRLPPALADAMASAAGRESDARVRLRLALVGGAIDGDRRIELLSTVVAKDATDKWCRMAVFTSLDGDAGDAGRLLARWIADPGKASAPGMAATVTGLAAQVGRRGDATETAAVVAAVGRLVDTVAGGTDARGHDDEVRGMATAVLVGLLQSRDGPQRNSLAALADESGRGLVADLVAWNRARAVDAMLSTDERLAAVRGLALAPFSEVKDVFVELLSHVVGTPATGEPPAAEGDGGEATPRPVAREAVTVLDRCRDSEVPNVILDVWPRLPADLRSPAAAILVRDAHRAETLLDAVATGRIRAADLDRSVVQNLRAFPVPAVRSLAEATLGPAATVRREEVVEAYRPSLGSGGDAEKGKAIFTKNCSTCHRIGDIGRNTGPNLVAMQARGPESILLGILDPNREVQPQYVAHVAITGDGRVVTGVIVAESEASVTLRSAEGVEETIARSDIEELQSTKRSLMPEGFERQIDQRGMADLLAWLMTAR